jgi:hypothetical protein
MGTRTGAAPMWVTSALPARPRDRIGVRAYLNIVAVIDECSLYRTYGARGVSAVPTLQREEPWN